MNLKILPKDSSVLTTPCISIKEKVSMKTISDMKKILKSENGVGLAAPQVGLNIRLILCKDDPDSEKVYVLLNPLILDKEGLSIDVEGCLSIPDLAVDVPRQTKIEVAYLDTEMNKKKLVAEGYFARVLQHEIDHLDGKLIIERGVEGSFFYKGSSLSKDEVFEKFLK
tara:strand:- start:420 stop:923 length:504 start_codon:yes stop_codon:yes gene_type:complete